MGYHDIAACETSFCKSVLLIADNCQLSFFDIFPRPFYHFQELEPGTWNTFCASYDDETKKVIIILNGIVSMDAIELTMPFIKADLGSSLSLLRLGMLANPSLSK